MMKQKYLIFLEKNKIPHYMVLDASGMATKDYKRLLKDRGLQVAINVTPCSKGGHMIRNSSGHCVVCNPSSLNYKKRYHQPGYVYIAQSSQQKDLIKIGLSVEVKKRISTLNAEKYAGYSDWKITFKEYVENCGAVENIAHKKLSEYKFSTSYKTHGRMQTTSELFKCNGEIALAALQKAITVSKSKYSRPAEKQINLKSKVELTEPPEILEKISVAYSATTNNKINTSNAEFNKQLAHENNIQKLLDDFEKTFGNLQRRVKIIVNKLDKKLIAVEHELTSKHHNHSFSFSSFFYSIILVAAQCFIPSFLISIFSNQSMFGIFTLIFCVVLLYQKFISKRLDNWISKETDQVLVQKELNIWKEQNSYIKFVELNIKLDNYVTNLKNTRMGETISVLPVTVSDVSRALNNDLSAPVKSQNSKFNLWGAPKKTNDKTKSLKKEIIGCLSFFLILFLIKGLYLLTKFNT